MFPASNPTSGVFFVLMNISSSAGIRALFGKIKQDYHESDVLSNNASLFKITGSVKDIQQQAQWEERVTRALKLDASMYVLTEI